MWLSLRKIIFLIRWSLSHIIAKFLGGSLFRTQCSVIVTTFSKYTVPDLQLLLALLWFLPHHNRLSKRSSGIFHGEYASGRRISLIPICMTLVLSGTTWATWRQRVGVRHGLESSTRPSWMARSTPGTCPTNRRIPYSLSRHTMGHFIFRWDQSLKLYSTTGNLVWYLINMQKVIQH